MQRNSYMQIINSTKLTCFDVDGTLIIHALNEETNIKHGGTCWKAHERHIAQLKAHKARGHTIWVWSAGGLFWAKEVIELLGLESYVDFVSDKPYWEYEDDPSWHRHIYYEPEDMKC